MKDGVSHSSREEPAFLFHVSIVIALVGFLQLFGPPHVSILALWAGWVIVVVVVGRRGFRGAAFLGVSTGALWLISVAVPLWTAMRGLSLPFWLILIPPVLTVSIGVFWYSRVLRGVVLPATVVLTEPLLLFIPAVAAGRWLLHTTTPESYLDLSLGVLVLGTSVYHALAIFVGSVVGYVISYRSSTTG